MKLSTLEGPRAKMCSGSGPEETGGSLKNVTIIAGLLALGGFVAIHFLNLHPALAIVAAAVLGLAVYR